VKNYEVDNLFSLVKNNGVLTFRSIFDFTGGITDVFAFLEHCREKNCTVIFDNENIHVKPESDLVMNMTLMLYAWIAENPKLTIDYFRYLDKLTQSSTDRKPIPVSTENEREV